MASNLARDPHPAIPSGNAPDAGATGKAMGGDGDPARARVCAFCYGTGMEVVPGRGARRCRCRTQEQSARLIAAARIPRRYGGCSLSNYHPERGNESQLRALSRAHRLVREYPAVERGLLFTGGVGTGKTHLSAAILRGLMEKGTPCLFYEFGALLKEVQGSYDPASQAPELKVLAPVYEAEVLVLDELGAVRPTDWVRDITTRIIGARYNERRLTICTTNYADARRADAETLEDRIGAPARSRLFEMCGTIVVEGDDYRRRFDSRQT